MDQGVLTQTQLDHLLVSQAERGQERKRLGRLAVAYRVVLPRLAVAYAREGRLDEARQHWERALVLDPGYAEPRRNLDLLRRLRKQ